MKHTYTLRVPLTDVDAVQVVWHGHYLRYFELARTEMVRESGLTPARLLAEGWLPVVIDYRVECLRSVRYDEVVHIETEVEAPESATLVFHSRVVGEDGAPRARGTVRLAVQHPERGLLYRWPEELAERIDHLLDTYGGRGDA